MSRTGTLTARTLARTPPVTGAAAEAARVTAAARGVQPWGAWDIRLTDGAMVVDDPERGVSLRLDVQLDGRPAVLLVDRATPSLSHVRLTAGDLATIELARRAPRDAIIRVLVDGPAVGATIVDVTATIESHAPSSAERTPQPRVVWETAGAPPGATVVRLDLPSGRPWWLVDARYASLEPPPRSSDPGPRRASSLRHHHTLRGGQRTVISLRLCEADELRPVTGPDAEATIATRRRESDAWLERSFPSGTPGAPIRRRLAAELLTYGSSSRLSAALDAVALATLDPHRARGMLLDSLAAWALDAEVPADTPAPAPLEAWATLRVHDLLVQGTGREDLVFLEEACSRLLTATSWWVDRLDPDGRNALHGGLPPMDGPRVLPRGVVDHAPGLAHADGTAWLAAHTVAMLELAATIARIDPAYEDMAVTFLDTVVTMIDSIAGLGAGLGMWDEAQGAYLDVARATDGSFRRIPLRSIVSLVPLLAVTVIPGETLERSPMLADRVDQLLAERPDLSGSIIRGHSGRRDRGDVLVSLVSRSRLGWALEHVLHPEGFLSPFGIRTLSRAHAAGSVTVDLGAGTADVRYRPAGARDADGAALWQGQVSVTLTCLLADALRRHGSMRGSPLLLEHPTGSGRMAVADEVADDLIWRVVRALGHLADADDPSLVGVDAIDAESGLSARPRGVSGRSSLPLAFLPPTDRAR